MTARLRIGRMLQVPSGAVHVREDGPTEAAPLVLLHGFAGSVHWFDRITPLLADSFRVVRVDLLGHGCTVGGGDLDAPGQSRMVAQVVERLGLAHVTAVGHSFGADVAVALAEHATPAVDHVVVVGQAPDFSYAQFPPGNAVMTLPVVGALLHRFTPPAVHRVASRVAFAPGFAGASFEQRDQAFADHVAMTAAMYRANLVDRRKRLDIRPLDQQLGELGLPALAIHGRHDQFFDCERTAARYTAAGCRVEIIDAAGHSPQVERPHLTATAIRDFVRGRR